MPLRFGGSMLEEIWKEIPGIDSYEVSTAGRVRRCKPARTTTVGKIIRPYLNNKGYPRVSLRKDGGYVKEYVHRLVLLAFSGPAPDGYECAHIDGNRQNAALENLTWATPSENNLHKRIHGTSFAGERSPVAKLTSDAVADIRGSRGIVHRNVLAAKYGICKDHVNRIQRGVSWMHIPLDQP